MASHTSHNVNGRQCLVVLDVPHKTNIMHLNALCLRVVRLLFVGCVGARGWGMGRGYVVIYVSVFCVYPDIHSYTQTQTPQSRVTCEKTTTNTTSNKPQTQSMLCVFCVRVCILCASAHVRVFYVCFIRSNGSMSITA